jgi:hypothetical protein
LGNIFLFLLLKPYLRRVGAGEDLEKILID